MPRHVDESCIWYLSGARKTMYTEEGDGVTRRRVVSAVSRDSLLNTVGISPTETFQSGVDALYTGCDVCV